MHFTSKFKKEQKLIAKPTHGTICKEAKEHKLLKFKK